MEIRKGIEIGGRSSFTLRNTTREDGTIKVVRNLNILVFNSSLGQFIIVLDEGIPLPYFSKKRF